MSLPVVLWASDAQLGASLGESVSVDGDVVVAGASGADGGATDSGAAYVFVKPPAGWADASQTAKLTASDGATDDYLGRSASISRDVVLVGASGDDDDGAESGSAYVFQELAAGWVDKTERSKITPVDAAADHKFGSSVAINNNLAVIGAVDWDDLGVVNRSCAYLYTFSGHVLTAELQINSPESGSDDEFATSVSAGNGSVLIGAPADRTDFEYYFVEKNFRHVRFWAKKGQKILLSLAKIACVVTKR